MTIYVDKLAWYNNAPIRGYWCHMATDAIDNLEELHTFAESLKLDRKYFQLLASKMPHYDLYEGKVKKGTGKQSQAIERGALLIDGTELARRCWLNELGRPHEYDPVTHARVIDARAYLLALEVQQGLRCPSCKQLWTDERRCDDLREDGLKICYACFVTRYD